MTYHTWFCKKFAWFQDLRQHIIRFSLLMFWMVSIYIKLWAFNIVQSRSRMSSSSKTGTLVELYLVFRMSTLSVITICQAHLAAVLLLVGYIFASLLLERQSSVIIFMELSTSNFNPPRDHSVFLDGTGYRTKIWFQASSILCPSMTVDSTCQSFYLQSNNVKDSRLKNDPFNHIYMKKIARSYNPLIHRKQKRVFISSVARDQLDLWIPKPLARSKECPIRRPI